MKRVFLFVVLLAAITSTHAAGPNEGGPILAREAYVYPAYDQAQWARRYTTKEEYDRVAADPDYVMEKLTYRSDGLGVAALLYRPRQTAGQRFPVVVFNRGSYVVGDIGGALAPMFHRLAGRGFVVVAPLYRGSMGSEGRDEMGGADLADLMNIVPVLAALEFADTDNIFLYGESRGGMMTYQALRDGFPARAAAVFGGFTDLGALFEAEPRFRQMAPTIWPDFSEHRDEILTRRSAVKWSDKLVTPLLIMHGGADADVSPVQALRLAEQLQQFGRTYELVVYAGDNHILSGNREERDRRAAAWFQRFAQRASPNPGAARAAATGSNH